MLVGTVNSHAFVLSARLQTGATIGELRLLVDELALTHRNLVHLAEVKPCPA
jgi:hypothetical protein